MVRLLGLVAAVLLLPGAAARAGGLPASVARQLPAGFVVLAVASGRLSGGAGLDYLVALARPGDDPDRLVDGGAAPARPLLVFRAVHGGGYVLAGRNDAVVMRHAQGGQCDPFDPDAGLVVKGAYVTVQNAVSCGDHWTDYITFRYDRAGGGGLLFDSEIYHHWRFNADESPDADVLVPDGPAVVTRGDPRRPVGFSAWRPAG